MHVNTRIVTDISDMTTKKLKSLKVKPEQNQFDSNI